MPKVAVIFGLIALSLGINADDSSYQVFSERHTKNGKQPYSSPNLADSNVERENLLRDTQSQVQEKILPLVDSAWSAYSGPGLDVGDVPYQMFSARPTNNGKQLYSSLYLADNNVERDYLLRDTQSQVQEKVLPLLDPTWTAHSGQTLLPNPFSYPDLYPRQTLLPNPLSYPDVYPRQLVLPNYYNNPNEYPGETILPYPFVSNPSLYEPYNSEQTAQKLVSYLNDNLAPGIYQNPHLPYYLKNDLDSEYKINPIYFRNSPNNKDVNELRNHRILYFSPSRFLNNDNLASVADVKDHNRYD